MTLRVNEPVPAPPRIDGRRRRNDYRKALRGELPAEALTNTGDREQLIHELWTAGWTDLQVAVHTRWTSYTVARIRERLGHAANHTAQRRGEVA